MQAVVMNETGDPDVLRVEQIDRPEPGDGELLIRVHAISVNPIDWKYRRGFMPKDLPAVLGSDVSGTVEVSRAEGFTEGDEVFGFAASGAYAEFATAPAAIIATKPAGHQPRAGRRDPVAGLTAWQALFDRGETPERPDGADRGCGGRRRPLRDSARGARRHNRDRHRILAQPRLRAGPRRG